MWPFARVVQDLSDEEKIGDRVEAVLGQVIVHQTELSRRLRTDPINPRAREVFWHLSRVCLAGKADFKRLGTVRFLR